MSIARIEDIENIKIPSFTVCYICLRKLLTLQVFCVAYYINLAYYFSQHKLLILICFYSKKFYLN